LNEHHEVVSETHPQAIRKVIGKNTAQLLTRIFEGVVERGTGVSARHEYISVAGKTGTSRKVIDGKYEPGKYTASFAGFFPAEDPKVVCLVMLDNPHEGGYTGGLASAPIFKAIAEKIIATSSWVTRPEQPVIARKENLVVPDVAGLDVEVASSMLSGRGFEIEQFGGGKVVLRQSPSPGTRTLPGTPVKITTSKTGVAVPKGFTIVPDVRRMSIRRAMNRLTMEDLEVVIAGSGVIVAQSPAPGQQVKVGTRVLLRCEPRGSRLVAQN
ncbi:MAG: PASTA domain-containing protein, partial [Bacteroidota bacterium]